MVWKELMFSGAGATFKPMTKPPGPRDWSPAMQKGKDSLKEYLAIVPVEMRVPLEDVRKANWPEVTWLVENGLAFIIKIIDSYHCVYIDPGGRVRMDQVVQVTLRNSP